MFRRGPMGLGRHLMILRSLPVVCFVHGVFSCESVVVFCLHDSDQFPFRRTWPFPCLTEREYQ
jgi:hypothetical protein